MASVGRVCEWGDKSSKLLYWLATRNIISWVILEIEGPQGDKVMSTPAMAKIFADYYQSLYVR